MKRRIWTTREYLKAKEIINYRRISLTLTDPIIEDISSTLGRSKYSVIKKLGFEKYKEEWEEWVTNFSRTHTYEETANRVGMSKSGLEKVVARTKNRTKVIDKHEHKSAKDIVTLMRSSYLPSYELAQFVVNSKTRCQKLFDKTFNVGGRWVHGMLKDDYWDLYASPPEKAFKSDLRVGPKRKYAILIPWVSCPNHPELDQYIEILRNYQKWLYATSDTQETLETLKSLLKKPHINYQEVDKVELVERTRDGYKAFCEIKQYLKNNTTESHRKNRYSLN